MRTPCHIVIAVSGLIVTFHLPLLAQPQAAEEESPRNVLMRVQQIERRLDSLETRQSETSSLLTTLVKKLERRGASAEEMPSQNSEGLRLMGAGVPPTPGPDDRWRYKFHQGRWWYLRPNNEWLCWSDDHWVPHRPASPAAARVVEGGEGAEIEQSISGPVTSGQATGSTAAGDSHEGLRKVEEAVGRLEKQVQRQADAQAILMRGQTVLIDAYQKQAAEVLRHEQYQRDSVGIENRPRARIR